MRRNFVYSIEGFVPPDSEKWGFGAELDGTFARDLAMILIPARIRKILQKDGREIVERITRIWDEDLLGAVPREVYKFASTDKGETYLLQYCQCPGDACDFGLSNPDEGRALVRSIDEIDELPPIRYSPHNVDNIYQSYMLASLFTHWANTARIILPIVEEIK